MIKRLVTHLFIAIACGLSSQAATLVEWNVGEYIYDSSNPALLSPPDADTFATAANGVDVGNFSLHGTAVQGSVQTGVFGARGWATGTPSNITSAGYSSFTLKAEAGSQLTVTSLGYSSYNSSASTAGPQSGTWGYRIDGGAWVLQDTDGYSIVMTSGVSNLMTWDLPDFTTSGTVEFAFWAWGGTATNRNVNIISSMGTAGELPGLVVNGSVTSAVPEPTRALLLAGAAVIGLIRRRRCKRGSRDFKA